MTLTPPHTHPFSGFVRQIPRTKPRIRRSQHIEAAHLPSLPTIMFLTALVPTAPNRGIQIVGHRTRATTPIERHRHIWALIAMNIVVPARRVEAYLLLVTDVATLIGAVGEGGIGADEVRAGDVDCGETEGVVEVGGFVGGAVADLRAGEVSDG